MGLREAVSRRRLRVRVMFFCTAGVVAASSSARASLLGGEWAGWACSFDRLTGAVQAVPDKYVSAEMREWDQVPRGFEECVTETWAASGEIARRTARFLPEDGCNTENLGAIVTRQALASPTLIEQSGTSLAWAIDGVHGSADRWRCETIFSGIGGVLPRVRRGALDALGLRTRVLLSFDVSSGSLIDGEPIIVHQERCWSSEVSSSL